MRIRDSSNLRPLSGAAAADRAVPTQANGASGSLGIAAPQDVATIMGIPESELTPKVRAALGRLMEDVARLREELDQYQKRIGHLEQLADQDALAPVLNRRAFVRELSRMMAYAERYSAQVSVVYFDIDGMKRINDAYGHAAGDAALKQAATILVDSIRASDVVGRLGGDEFGVILAQADRTTAHQKAAQLAAAIGKQPFVWNGTPLVLSASFGIHSFSAGENVDQALAAADRAMYDQKRAAEVPAAEPESAKPATGR
ncbi:MAG: GGDEF domain-containing protein [Kiloniellales bacterium]